MCGIAGLVLSPAQNVTSEQVRSLSQHLEHRGPDDYGSLSFGKSEVCLDRKIGGNVLSEVVLVHRRLSILDLTSAGWQPMGAGGGRYYIVFNGEIYNYRELRSELESLGHRFGSRSDTEVLLATCIEWGSQGLNRLVGMFAFTILDVERRTLFLARDFFGIKPLYYTYWEDGFAFASEMKALIELPGVTRRVNPQRLYEYLRFGITDHGGETLFAEIKQLPSAHYMEVPLDNPSEAFPVRYWQLDLNQRAELSFQSAADCLRDLFVESVRLHLRSDVPVGAALSGGIDSSAIVMTMRHIDPHVPIHTFSYIAGDPIISEQRWVDLIGQVANVTSHKVSPGSDELSSDLDTLIESQEEAFGSTSIYAQRQVFREAHRAGIKVMLDGQGADELLGGYTYFISARLGSLLRQGRWTDVFRLLRSLSGSEEIGPFWLCARAIDFLIPSTLQRPLRCLIRKEFVPRWLNLDWFIERGVQIRGHGYTNGKEVLRQSLYHDLVEASLPHLLRYEDRNSMAFSIESRVPFLTPKLANFIFSLPEEYIIAPDGTTKAVFRRAMRGIVPDSILDRRDKIGFATPEKHWLIGLRPWVKRVLKSETAMQIKAIKVKILEQEWDSIVEGSRPFDWRVWRWVNLILWAEKFGVTFH